MRVDLTELNSDERAEAVISALLGELAAARNAVESAQRRAGGIRKMIEAVVEMFPVTEDLLPDDLDGDEEPRPRGAEAVRRALAGDQGVWFTVPGIVGLLNTRKWLPDSPNPANAVRTAADRMVEQGLGQKGRAASGGPVTYRVGKPLPDEEPF